MPARTLIARHYLTRLPVRVEVAGTRLRTVEPVEASTASLPWIAPALVDLQVNGFGGVDFQQDTLEPADLARAVAGLRRAGCARCLVTLVTAAWPAMIRRLRRLAEFRRASPELASAIGGWHIEGPFLSAQPGFHGAHDPALMLDPRAEHLAELRATASDEPVLLTLAPERAGALEAIRLAATLGVQVSLGHSNADAATLRSAWQAGASGFTHLGNACPVQLNRHDNILWRVLDAATATADSRPNGGSTGPAWVSLIPDGHHISPALFRLLHRLIPAQRVVYVSDAMAAGGAPPGRYALGTLNLEVGEDGVVRLPGRPQFAGSALRPIDGVFRAAAMLERHWTACWDAFSVIPARRMGWSWGLEPGAEARFCLLSWNNPDAAGHQPPDQLETISETV